MKSALVLLVAALLAACSNKPPVPEWQLASHAAAERSLDAYLVGNAHVERQEFALARSALARTGRPELLARLELRRCAAQVASLVFEPCSGFEPLRRDAGAAERAYADYLAGSLAPRDAGLLPPAQRAAAAAGADASALRGIDDPLSRLVAAGVLLRTGRATPEVLALASDTASAQGWRRPLLAWLEVQARRAEHAGATEEAGRLRRRIVLVDAATPRAPPPQVR